jgi:hypothetical protein
MACAQLQVVPAGSSAFRRFGDFSQPGRINAELRTDEQCVFAGDARKISVIWHNAGDKVVEVDVRARIYQTSSATTILLNEVPWKKLQVLPQQTVIESAQFDFPTVKAETKFLLQWLENTNRVIGKTEVLVYPTNLLADLKMLAGNDPVGIFDPQNQLKPLLKKLQVEFTDLEDAGLDNFQGKLAIIGPFPSKSQMREGLASQIQALARKNTAVVWIQPPPEKRDKLQPSFYFVPENQIAVVIVQPDLVANLPESPRAQLNLIYFCQRALHHEPFHLPQSFPQP